MGNGITDCIPVIHGVVADPLIRVGFVEHLLSVVRSASLGCGREATHHAQVLRELDWLGSNRRSSPQRLGSLIDGSDVLKWNLAEAGGF